MRINDRACAKLTTAQHHNLHIKKRHSRRTIPACINRSVLSRLHNFLVIFAKENISPSRDEWSDDKDDNTKLWNDDDGTTVTTPMMHSYEEEEEGNRFLMSLALHDDADEDEELLLASNALRDQARKYQCASNRSELLPDISAAEEAPSSNDSYSINCEEYKDSTLGIHDENYDKAEIDDAHCRTIFNFTSIENIYSRGTIEAERCRTQNRDISCDRYVKMRNYVIDQAKRHISDSECDQNYIDLYAMLYRSGMNINLRASQQSEEKITQA